MKHEQFEVAVLDYSTATPSRKVLRPVVEQTREVEKRRRLRPKERARLRRENRQLWKKLHVTELNETKRLLYRALRLLRSNRVKLPPEMEAVLSRHESLVAARAAQRKQALKQFEVTGA
jgi:hypothetical protein